MRDENAISKLHYEIVRAILAEGACPTNQELQEMMGGSNSELEALLLGLSDIHGIVLHLHQCRPWIIHPFSLTPTLNLIQSEQHTWWAPCVWCALGVSALIKGEVVVHTRVGAETENLKITVRDGIPQGSEEMLVHFAIPPVRAWNNVHEHCSMVLPFRSEEDIHAWCSRHKLPFGEPVPLPQVAKLAQHWYGSHADPDWHKWTIDEAQDIFRRVGLTSPFWDIEPRAGRF